MDVRINLRPALLAGFLSLACAYGTFATATMSRECPDPSKEDREKMAAVHEQMAACLRSDKPFAECRNDLAKSHHEMMGMGCPGQKMHPHKDQKPQPAPTK